MAEERLQRRLAAILSADVVGYSRLMGIDEAGRKLDEKCPYQVVLPRRQLTDDSAILDFLLAHVGWFDMYVEDDHAAYVRYCFENPLDAEIFRARFDPKRAIQARGMSV